MILLFKILSASLLILLILFVSCAANSEALSTISEKRLKMLKLDHPKKNPDQPPAFNSSTYRIDQEGKALPKDMTGKISVKSTSPIITEANFTKGINSSNKTIVIKDRPNKGWELFTKVNAIGIYVDCKFCANYESLKRFDNAPPILGNLTEKGRVYAPVANNPEWLRNMNTTVIILDPPYKIAQKVQMIHIVAQMPAINYTLSKNSLTFYHTRYVDSQCTSATITGSNLIPILEDTIQYLKSGCKDTKLVSKSMQTLNHTKINLASSAKYQELKALHEAKICAKTPGCKL